MDLDLSLCQKAHAILTISSLNVIWSRSNFVDKYRLFYTLLDKSIIWCQKWKQLTSEHERTVWYIIWQILTISSNLRLFCIFFNGKRRKAENLKFRKKISNDLQVTLDSLDRLKQSCMNCKNMKQLIWHFCNIETWITWYLWWMCGSMATAHREETDPKFQSVKTRWQICFKFFYVRT